MIMSFRKKITTEVKHFLTKSNISDEKILTNEDIQHLPAPVIKWLHLSGAVGRKKPKNVWMQQSFKLKLKPDQKKWYQSKSTQIISAALPSFIWMLRLNMAPMVTILGRDKLDDGKGEMQMNLYGVFNILKEKGEKIDEGTLQRYLGETVWMPSAVISPYITWKETDHQSAEAILSYKGITASGKFFFNENGHFYKFETHRYKENLPDSKRLKWVIVAREHHEMDGIVIPTLLDVTWHLEEGPWTWSILKVEKLKYNVTKNPKPLF